jgi:hypothetical protein
MLSAVAALHSAPAGAVPLEATERAAGPHSSDAVLPTCQASDADWTAAAEPTAL